MKIVSHYLQSIEGIAIYPIISLLIFMGMFTLITIWALRIRKTDILKMKNLPFNDGGIENEEADLN